MPIKELEDIQTMHMINRLPGMQKAVLGYEQYKVRSVVDQGRLLHWVDVYTKTGLVIKTKYDYISSSKLSRFIIDVMASLRFRNKTTMTCCIQLSSMIVLVALWKSILAADFIQNNTCGLANPAFIETFSVAYPGGNGGDLDETKWAVSRVTAEYLYAYQMADLPACKQGAPSTAFPPGEILVCDNTMPGYSGRLMTPIAGQTYGITCFRAHQPFDFTNRTGTIAFDVDAWCIDGLAHWASFALTENPIPAPNIGNPVIEKNGNPGNGMVVRLWCNGSATVLPTGYLYHNYAETSFSTTQCYTAKAGFLNHIEIKVSQNRVEIWASDYSQDGKTFPSFKMIASVDNPNFPFTKGYVNFCVNNHATQKYGYGRTGVHYWDNIGFDGPVLPADRIYQVPESLTPYDATYMNTGYSVKDIGNGGGAYTCCGTGTGKVTPFTLKNVDLTNATSAAIVLDAWYLMYGGQGILDPTKINLQYRLNNGAWTDRYLTAGEIASLTWTQSTFINPFIPQLIQVPLTSLSQGDNTLDFRTINASSYEVAVANIELNVRGGSGTTAAPVRKPAVPEKNNLLCSINPLSSEICLRIQVSEAQKIMLDIYNASGRHIRSLADGIVVNAGSNDFIWSGTDESGQMVGTGVYCALLKSGNQFVEKRLMKLR